MNNKQSFLEKENISKLLIRLSSPAAIGMLVMMLYSAVDMFFVGRYIGVKAIVALSFIMPIGFLIPAIGMSIGIGGASLVSRSLGANKFEFSKEVLGNIVSLTIVACSVFSVLAFSFSDAILELLGVSENVFPLTKEYYMITLFGFPFLGIMMSLNNILRAEGKALHSMWFMVASAVLNVILDLLFIVYLDLGLAGAAIATVIAQVVPALYLLIYYFKNKNLNIQLKYLAFKSSIIKEIVSVGASSLARQSTSTLVAIVLNRGLVHYGNDNAVAVYGILNRIIMFVYFPIIGLVQGFLPIAGFNYGARNFDRLKEVLKVSIIWSFGVGVISSILLFSFSHALFNLFTNDSKIIDIGAGALKIIMTFFSLVSIQIIVSSYFQAIGDAKSSFLLTISRQVFFLIPLALLLPSFFGLKGLWIAFPIADFLSIVLTLVYFFPEWIKLKRYIREEEFV